MLRYCAANRCRGETCSRSLPETSDLPEETQKPTFPDANAGVRRVRNPKQRIDVQLSDNIETPTPKTMVTGVAETYSMI